MNVRRITALLAGLAAVVSIGTACSSSSPGSATQVSALVRLLLAAPEKTESAKTVRMQMTTKITGAQTATGPSDVTVSGSGEFDFTSRRGTLDFTVPNPDGGTLMIESILDGTTVYEKFPPEMGVPLPAGKTWVRIDVAKAAEQQGIDANALSQPSSGDPTAAVNFLRGASNAQRVGEERLRGEAVEHYRATIDLDKAAQQAPELRAAYDTASAMLGTHSFPVDAWIDAEGRVRKIVYSVRIGSGTANPALSGATMSQTFEFLDFGASVDAAAPPASQVIDMADVFGQQAGSGS